MVNLSESFNRSIAVKTIRNIQGVDVLGWTEKTAGDEIVEYRVRVKISSTVQEILG